VHIFLPPRTPLRSSLFTAAKVRLAKLKLKLKLKLASNSPQTKLGLLGPKAIKNRPVPPRRYEWLAFFTSNNG
jgi:hypothetical protein